MVAACPVFPQVCPLPVFYLSISLLLYLLALFFDGALMSGGRHMPALQMLLYGPWGMPFGLYQWFANPLLLGYAWQQHAQPRKAPTFTPEL